jgi:hypothetical protein
MRVHIERPLAANSPAELDWDSVIITLEHGQSLSYPYV